MTLVAEKMAQAGRLLNELDIDLWLLFVRETSLQADPALALVVGEHVTWPSFFLYSRTGQATALVGNFDEEIFKATGCFDSVMPYTQGVREDLVRLLTKLDPKTIAINYSRSDPSCDGLTHGMYLLLCDYLGGTPYRDRLTSAETFLSRLRSSKTPGEIALAEKAARIAADIWSDSVKEISIGMTEIEIARLIDTKIAQQGVVPSFDTIVNAGDKTKPGHGHPTDAVLERGDLLHVDFGVRYQDFCSDIQRLAYFARPGESAPPPELLEAFSKVNEIIDTTARACLPGVQGWEVDAIARRMLTEDGYEEYQHALGHQLGRAVHDGGGIIGPRWERYGKTPTIPLEENALFTLELEILLPGIGCVGLEEDICITNKGGRFLCPRQLELIRK